MTSAARTAQVNRAYGTTAGGTYGRRAAGSRQTGLNSSAANIIKIAAVLMIALFVLISLQAYTATLQHENNVLRETNECLQADIDSLNSQIVEETKVTRIEKTATQKYGMVYPTSDNCITIKGEEDTGVNLASTIRSEAYN